MNAYQRRPDSHIVVVRLRHNDLLTLLHPADDAKIVRIWSDTERGTINLILEHPDYPECAEGAIPEEAKVITAPQFAETGVFTGLAMTVLWPGSIGSHRGGQ